MDYFQKLALNKTKETPIRMWFFTLVEFKGTETKIIKSFTKPAKDSLAKMGKKAGKKTIKIEEPEESVGLFGD